MEITIGNISPRDSMQKILVRVCFYDPSGPPNNSGEVDVFIEQSDSYQEIRRRAIEAARSFLEKVLAAPPIEAPDDV
jgi:ribosomal protein L16/L10AE